MRSARVAAARVVFALACAGSAQAHALDVGTARVTLRDAHVEVIAEWDLFLLVEGTPTTVATASESDLVTLHAKLEHAIEAQTVLEVDARTTPMALTGFPGPNELRGIAAALSAEGKDHGALVRMRLEAPAAFPAATSVALRTPVALGPVLVSFVQPASSLVAPGGRASFPVLTRADATVRTPTHASSPQAWAAGLVAALVLSCLIAVASRLRKSP